MKKIQVIIKDKNTLVLQEDAQTGDIIDLSSIQTIDQTNIHNIIEKEKEASYQKQINEQMQLKIEAINNENKIKLIEQKNKFNYELEILNSKNKQLELEKNNEIANILKDKNVEIQLIKTQNQTIINELEAKINEANNIKKLEIENNKNQIEQKYREELLKLKSKIEYLENQNELKLQQQENEFIRQKNEIKENLENQNRVLQTELERIKLAKSTLNIKMLGEELERWCNEEYESYASIGFENCTWEKDNTSMKDDDEVKGTKADYIFRSYLNKEHSLELSSVCCEMKNEALNSKNKKKNADHYSKLDKDRNKKNCEYALLISELEWDSPNDAPIKKVRDYEKMYVVRPQYFITFLSMISSLSNKYNELLIKKQQDQINLLSSLEIIEEFEQFKKTYIENPLDTLIKKIEKIQKSSEAITSANKIITDTCNEILFTTIINMKEKIERFNIKKISNKIKKIEN